MNGQYLNNKLNKYTKYYEYAKSLFIFMYAQIFNTKKEEIKEIIFY